MKKLITLITMITLMGSNLFAQLNNNLVVFSSDGQKFYLVLNGIKQNSTSQTNVKVTNLTNPNYKAKIIFENKAIPDIDQNVYMMDGGEQKNNYEFTCSINKAKNGYKLRYMSAAPFASAQTSADQHTVTYTTGQPSDASTTNTTTSGGSYGGGTTVGVSGGTDGGSSTTTTTTTTGTGNGTVGLNVGVNANGTGVSMNVNINDGTGMNGTQTTTTHSTTTTTTSGTGMNTTVTTSGTDGGSTSSSQGGTNVNVGTNVNGTADGNINMNVTTSGTGMNSNTTTSNSGSTSTNYDQTSTNSGTVATNYLPGYNGAIGCPYPMSPADFADAKKSIEAKSFDDTKLTMAKQVINANCLLSSQVKEVMLLFSFENTRLDLAKYSYGRTYDQGNYYKLNDAFTFESSIDELNNYIQKK